MKESKKVESKLNNILRLDFFIVFLIIGGVGFLFYNIESLEAPAINGHTIFTQPETQYTEQTEYIPSHKGGNYLSVDLKKVTPAGSPPRLEREYTFDFLDSNLDSQDPNDLAEEVLDSIKKNLDNGSWAVPKIIESDYFTDDIVKEYFYRDIYFDTPDNLSYNSNTLYRLRNRFKGIKAHEKHLKDQDNPDYWPYRIEFQAKTDVREEDDGFSSVKEARFEFREESKPFGPTNLPPERPWNLNEFIGYLQSGQFKQYHTWPAKALVEYLIPEHTKDDKLFYEPRVFVMTERFRSHLNIKSKWGSGPNPTQAYIITLDRSEIYPPSYLNYLEGNGKKPKSLGVMVEVETEYERNVSSELDKQMLEAMESGNSSELAYLNLVREAFFQDQKNIMKTMIDYFAKKGIEITPNKKTKYKKAFDMLPKKMRKGTK